MMTAPLKNPPIRYPKRKPRPPKGISLAELEAVAWGFRNRKTRLEDCRGLGPEFKSNAVIYEIHKLIIEQHGWPERD